MMKHLTALIAFLIMIGSQASAFDTNDLRRLIDTGDCVECDFDQMNEFLVNYFLLFNVKQFLNIVILELSLLFHLKFQKLFSDYTLENNAQCR